MNRNIFKSILGIVALSALGVAHAAVVPLPTTGPGPSLNIGDIGLVPVTYEPHGTTTFGDTFYFSLASTSNVNTNVTNIALAGFGFTSLGATLYDITTSTVVGSGLNISLVPGTAGNNYLLEVYGNGTSPLGGLFGGAVHVSAVPIPAAAWLLISGLAGIGAMARRRKSEAAS